MRMEMIRLEHVTKSFGRYKALDDVSLSLIHISILIKSEVWALERMII